MDMIARSPAESLFTLCTDAWTQPWWDAAREHRLTAPCCEVCGRFRMPPTPFCPHCRSQKLRWPTLSGRGTLFSYTVVTRAVIPAMESCIPYVPALVDLDDAPGARLTTAIVGVPIDAIVIGAPVKVVFETRTDGVVVPRFTLVTA
jgi:uncharacterized OB-fold protein